MVCGSPASHIKCSYPISYHRFHWLDAISMDKTVNYPLFGMVTIPPITMVIWSPPGNSCLPHELPFSHFWIINPDVTKQMDTETQLQIHLHCSSIFTYIHITDIFVTYYHPIRTGYYPYIIHILSMYIIHIIYIYIHIP